MTKKAHVKHVLRETYSTSSISWEPIIGIKAGEIAVSIHYELEGG